MMEGFAAAWQFLTRFPLPGRRLAEPRPGQATPALGWFPLVGGILGLVLLIVDQVGQRLFAPPVVDALVVAAWVACSGGLHLDGLIDTADGLHSGPDPASRLAAMRQSTVGSVGALVGATTLIASFVALGAVPVSARPATVLLAPTLGRLAILLAYYWFPYGRAEDTLSRSLKAGANHQAATLGVATTGLIVVAVLGPAGLWSLPILALVVLLAARALLARLPGLTGDTCGALCEVVQLGVLLTAPIWWPMVAVSLEGLE